MSDWPDPATEGPWPPGLHYQRAVELIRDNTERPWQREIHHQLIIQNQALLGILRALMALQEKM